MIRHMIYFKNLFVYIYGHIIEDLYNRLIKKTPRVKEEDTKIREHEVRKLCDIKSEEETKSILRKIKPLIIKKKIIILIMGG